LIRHLGMSDVADKLTILLPYATEIVTIKPNDDENSLQTILFGDLQISNILFKRKDTKVNLLNFSNDLNFFYIRLLKIN